MDFSIPPPSEADIQAAILQYLGARGHFVWRNNTGAFVIPQTERHARRFFRASKKGVADIVGVQKGGRFLAVEVKRPGKKPTPDQKEFLDRVNREGGIAIVATSVDDVISAGL